MTEYGLERVYPASFDEVLSDTDVVQPDLPFVSNARAPVLTAADVRRAPVWIAATCGETDSSRVSASFPARRVEWPTFPIGSLSGSREVLMKRAAGR